MSRIGKQPVNIPEDVQVSIDSGKIKVKGNKGELFQQIPKKVSVEEKDKQIVIKPKKENDEAKSAWGLIRSLIFNMIKGVTEGFQKELEIKGIGYKAALKGDTLELKVGLSHPVEMEIPEGLDAEVKDETQIKVSGVDKQKVGQFAAKIRSKRPPEPYKGKGIRYKGENVRRKEGKKAVGSKGPGV